MVSVISFDDFADCAARLRTSLATTANPLPCSPALAASIDALRDSMFVLLEMLLITAANSSILPDNSFNSLILLDVSDTILLRLSMISSISSTLPILSFTRLSEVSDELITSNAFFSSCSCELSNPSSMFVRFFIISVLSF